IPGAAATFPGIEHRLEFVRTVRGISFYNDSAATIPDATVAAAMSFKDQVIVIAGGTDKELDFSVLSELKDRARKVYLLEGSASAKIADALHEAEVPFIGPFPSLKELMSSIMAEAGPGDIVLFSPGCTSFEMFLNEFDRGRRFKAMVEELPD
ncbi:MAG: UDP-N-acetylmuramoyl-L-alanine--D-glutamate ligase, partial [Spirochaetales bacterium]|nr:UDP-N-acetylmuramoyl-L-alanine--D-glutamate ligase [Spirochaetales bacterium]